MGILVLFQLGRGDNGLLESKYGRQFCNFDLSVDHDEHRTTLVAVDDTFQDVFNLLDGEEDVNL